MYFCNSLVTHSIAQMKSLFLEKFMCFLLCLYLWEKVNDTNNCNLKVPLLIFHGKWAKAAIFCFDLIVYLVIRCVVFLLVHEDVDLVSIWKSQISMLN